tara:strand:- start:5515 stop:6843 length:1329 start_codon:yes stop_codon:yes gene_type:complete
MGLLENQTEQEYYNGNDFGGYQFISINDVVDNFTAVYVGEGKILSKTNRADISFHAHRALQELSFDTFKSCKTQEIEVPASLTIPLPQDYVNYVKLSWSDDAGIEHIIYPASKTSNPKPIKQNSEGDYTFQAVGTLTTGSTNIVLDKEYANIAMNMNVSAHSIPAGCFVNDISHSGGITTIGISIVGQSTPNATYTGDETITFTLDSSLVEQVENSFTLSGLSWTAGEDKITATSGIGNVKVGMKFAHDDFATLNVLVLDVTGSVITVSAVSSSTSSSQTASFISYTKSSDTWDKYKSNTPSENNANDYDDYENDIYWPNRGRRYGLDPQHAQVNGSYYIDCSEGKIHFSSNLSGKTVILKYISDSLGTDAEMQVHKFAEEAIYKWIAYGCMSARIDVPEYVIRRLKKEKFAETRKAKLRLSNIKLEEITQILRGKSKQIKH